MTEICGDGPMSPAARIAYLFRNLARNVAGGFAPLTLRRWHPGADLAAISGASPGRLLTETFVTKTLPRLKPAGPVRVLDIGCGGGRMARLLAAAGYSGDYLGVDTENRFQAPGDDEGNGFTVTFIQCDARTVALEGPFDMIVSVSALEHIPDDTALIARLSGLLAEDGLQLHIVPGPCGLFTYLWHGYRQYGRRAIGDRFGSGKTTVYRLGGAASFAVHLGWITVPENLLRFSLRQRAAGCYRAMVALALKLDRLLPFASVMYAICASAAEQKPRT